MIDGGRRVCVAGLEIIEGWCAACHGYRPRLLAECAARVPPGVCPHCLIGDQVLLLDPNARPEWLH